MKYLASIKSSFRILAGAIKAMFRHPIVLVPLFILWGVYILGAYFYYYKVDFSRLKKEHFDYSYGLILLCSGLIINALTILISCSILMEIIQQKETGKRINLGKAIADTFLKNGFKLILLSIIWLILFLLLGIIQWIVKRKINQTVRRTGIRNISAKGITMNADTLQDMTGIHTESVLSALFKGLARGIRMMCFLIVPAFAWENLGFGKSLSRGTRILKARIHEFITGFALSSLIKYLIGLPIGVMIYFAYKKGYHFDSWQLIAVALYALFTWSFMIFLEQFFIAELYLWQLKYERACVIAGEQGVPMPSIESIERPSFLDDMPDLMDVGNENEPALTSSN